MSGLWFRFRLVACSVGGPYDGKLMNLHSASAFTAVRVTIAVQIIVSTNPVNRCITDSAGARTGQLAIRADIVRS